MYVNKEQKGVNKTETEKQMCSIREIAKSKLISEHALRILVRSGSIPVIYVGKKALINIKLLEKILGSNTTLKIDTKKQEEKNAKKKSGTTV